MKAPLRVASATGNVVKSAVLNEFLRFLRWDGIGLLVLTLMKGSSHDQSLLVLSPRRSLEYNRSLLMLMLRINPR